MDEKKMKQALSVYETICRALDKDDWKYTKNDEELVINCKARGEDLPLDLYFMVHPGSQAVSLVSPMPFRIADDKKVELAVAVCVANDHILNGCFDFNIANGDISFRMVSSFRESILSEELFLYMIWTSAQIVDDYNDKFLMISKGMMSLDQLAEWEDKRRKED